MIKIIISTLILIQSSIYAIQFKDIDGADMSLSPYRGKKILLVNIATGSIYANQIGQLQQLHQLFLDSLVIIAFPSNSFGKESRTDQEIKAICDSLYHTTFKLAQ